MPIAPKFHQMWKSNDIPEPFKEAQSAVQDLCKTHSWEYRLWVETEWCDLLDSEYAFLRKTYEKLNPIQKVHLAKYMILYHFGGAYVDLDCTPTSQLNVWMTSPSDLILARDQHGYACNVFMARPKHVFFKHLLRDIIAFKSNHVLQIFRHYEIMAKSGKLAFQARAENTDKSTGVHVQSQEIPLVSKVAHNVPSTWREWDSDVYEYLEYAWQHRDKIMLVSGVVLALIVLILIAVVFSRSSGKQSITSIV